MSKKQIIVKGIEYESIMDACRKFGVAIYYENIKMYKKYHNTSYEEAILYYSNNGNDFKHGKNIVVGNTVYRSIIEACISLKINYSNLLRYAKYHGIPYEEAIEKYLNRKNANKSTPVTVKGIKYKSIIDACRKFGVDMYYENIKTYKRYHNTSYEEAILYYSNNGNDFKHGKTIVVGNTVYRSIKNACVSLGVKYPNLLAYANYHGIPHEEAIKKYLDGKIATKNIPVTVKGIKYKSIRNACEALNIEYYIVCNLSRDKHIPLRESLLNYVETNDNISKQGGSSNVQIQNN